MTTAPVTHLSKQCCTVVVGWHPSCRGCNQAPPRQDNSDLLWRDSVDAAAAAVDIVTALRHSDTQHTCQEYRFVANQIPAQIGSQTTGSTQLVCPPLMSRIVLRPNLPCSSSDVISPLAIHSSNDKMTVAPEASDLGPHSPTKPNTPVSASRRALTNPLSLLSARSRRILFPEESHPTLLQSMRPRPVHHACLALRIGKSATKRTHAAPPKLGTTARHPNLVKTHPDIVRPSAVRPQRCSNKAESVRSAFRSLSINMTTSTHTTILI